MLYASIATNGRPAFGSAITGVPPMQGFQFNEYLAAGVGYVMQSPDAVPYVDVESGAPDLTKIGTTTSKALIANAERYAQQMQATGAAIASLVPGRSLGIYTGVPLGGGWQYDFTAATAKQRLKDNTRFAAMQPFDDFAWLGIDCYVWQDDRAGMNRAAAKAFSVPKLASAALYGRKVVQFLSPVYVGNGGGDDLPDDVLAGLLDAGQGLDKCVWAVVDESNGAQRAKAWIDRITAIAATNGLKL